jgi:hypothetical protein
MAMPWEEYASDVKPWEEYAQPAKPSTLDAIKQGAGNLAAGAVRGAGSIGATLLTPFDAAARAMGVQNDFIGRDDRRAQMDEALANPDLRVLGGADPNSWLYKGGKLAGEIAGTAGAGGVLANGARALGGTRAMAGLEPIVNGVARGLETGGFRVGDLAGTGMGTLARMGTGAAVGGTAAGMVNPEDAGAGALIGGALPGAVKVAGEAGKLAGRGISGLAKNTLGMTTGAGAETFGTAYRAGRDGSTSFLDNMRGNVAMTDVLDGAKDALSKMRIERGNQYRSGMVDIANDKSVIDFTPIEQAVNSLQKMGVYKGQVINKNAAGTVDEVSGLVNQWKSLDPAEFHTPEGLDALKKALGDVRDATQFGTPGRRAADTAYNAVKAQIERQAPTYAKVMKDYSQASEVLTEIEKSLSLGNKAAADTSMRKLQSLMRNNVNTNYGNRLGMAKTLEEEGADILPAVAGQAASSFTPRGLQGLAATGAGFASLANPASLAFLPFTSPRLMGELSYGLGAMNRGIGGAANSARHLLPNSQPGLLGAGAVAPDELGLLTQGVYRAAPLLAGYQ